MSMTRRMLPAATVLALAVGSLWIYQKSRVPEKALLETPAAVYTTRGTIAQLPGTSRAAMLQIHHEEIPEFKDRDGNVVGMNSMIMPFSYGADMPLGELRVGDEVTFTFEHCWGEPCRIVSLSRLPKK